MSFFLYDWYWYTGRVKCHILECAIHRRSKKTHLKVCFFIGWESTGRGRFARFFFVFWLFWGWLRVGLGLFGADFVERLYKTHRNVDVDVNVNVNVDDSYLPALCEA